MKTECNGDWPYFVYADWLQEQGWEVELTEEEVYYSMIGDCYSYNIKTGLTNIQSGGGYDQEPDYWYYTADTDLINVRHIFHYYWGIDAD
jgi:hypothetical protein